MNTSLILDEQSVERHEGVTFRLNPSTKHPENPILSPGENHQWDSLQISWPATVLYDKQAGLFRCWYSGMNAEQHPGRTWLPGYAESADGIRWTRPNLGMVQYDGQETNMIKIGWRAHILSFVALQPDAPAEKRFFSYWTEFGVSENGGSDFSFLGKSIAYSPDGIHWTRSGVSYQGKPFDRASLQDISQLLYDPEEKDPSFRYKGYTQLIAKRAYDGREMVRHIGLVHGETPDQVADAKEANILAPEEGIDEELHFASVHKAGGQYLMLFESDVFSTVPLRGDLRLAASADGRKFRRVHKHHALVERGGRGMWDENLLVTTTSSVQEVGDTVYIFYIGCPGIYNSWPPEYSRNPAKRGSMFYPSYLGVATLPRDRYAYVEGPGRITTRPLAFHPGSEIWLNTDDLAITAEALDASGKVRAEGKIGHSLKNSVYRRVVWNNPVPAGEHSLRLTLPRETKIFSVGIDGPSGE